MTEVTVLAPLVAVLFSICWTGVHCKCLSHSDSVDYKQRLIDQFKLRVLHRLGYTSPPNMTLFTTGDTRHRRSSQFLQDRDLAIIDGILRPIKPTVYKASSNHPNNSSEQFSDVTPLQTLTFEIDDESSKRLIGSAWLRFCDRIPQSFRKSTPVNKRGRLQVYMIQKEARSHSTRRHLVFSRPINALLSSCLNVDVTDAIKDTFRGNVTFVTVLLNRKGDDKTILPNRGSILAKIRSTLLVNLAERETIRVKREAGKTDCTAADKETKCCRYHTYISFKEIGWDDWVIAPSGYDAYYCKGECPHRYKMAHTFAGIKSLLHLVNPARVPSPTCTATRLRPLTLLHLDDTGKMAYSDYPDMIVDECQCS